MNETNKTRQSRPVEATVGPEQLAEILAAANFACDVLAVLYFKHQLKIGPYASQAHKAQMHLANALGRFRVSPPNADLTGSTTPKVDS